MVLTARPAPSAAGAFGGRRVRRGERQVRDLGPDEVVEVLRCVHDLAEGQRSALEARLKHMGRLGFPKAAPVGRGRRNVYGLEELMKVAVAFQLVEVGTASAWAVEIVAAEWALIARALAGARGAGSSLVVLSPRAAPALKGARRGAARAWGSARLIGRRAPVASAKAGDAAMVVLDPLAVVSSVRAETLKLEGIGSDEFDGALAAMAELVRVT